MTKSVLRKQILKQLDVEKEKFQNDEITVDEYMAMFAYSEDLLERLGLDGFDE